MLEGTNAGGEWRKDEANVTAVRSRNFKVVQKKRKNIIVIHRFNFS